ncbi:PilW family protein [Xanthomonas arboricola pv. juglandis]|jgi:type IV pilus assembly protein PilW|uniref:PilW family protein n=1 Tax=Xanthomonas arboricola TaxID=56448 RepID=UPI00057F150F|nr:PilW family protein [Xanthomonas arboricola]MCC8475032.1 PilW family protein [Xanthomonas arboricola]MDN0221431.1 PilW family protein [Xanthomonas arboricola pv. juglandis]MDN0225705.1 PilW family protein [Xanthomonas arboricola pv. juglandis]MDN0229901.1 PilW family protein [Xanthomonas arboricola pv. juglandis]MDN0234187.1 PilW family protein [Xanthomonas arboricola pv. juglandis]
MIGFKRGRLRVSGVSLIELMIALVIGLVLMLGILQVFAASKTAYRLSEGLARTQENARFAIDYLQRDVRMAGHFGCVSDQSHLQNADALQSNFASNADQALNFKVSIQGYEANGTAPSDSVTLGAPTGGWSPGLPTSISALSPLAGSDIVVLRFLSPQGTPVNTVATGASTTKFTVSPARWVAFTQDGVANPQLFGVADCTYADVFQASATSASTGEVTVAKAISRYSAQPTGQTNLYRAESLVYYVATNSGGEPALFRARYGGAGYTSEELVEGVESLQFIYGQDRITDLTVNPPSGYIDVQNTAATLGSVAAQWRRVGSVQIGLLMRSPENSAATAPAVANRPRVLGVEFAPPSSFDGRVRGVYETTAALRNRLYGN